MTPDACPKCGNADHIDIAATIWVRIFQEEDSDDIETDADFSGDGSHEYDPDSCAVCRDCDHMATLEAFTRAKRPPPRLKFD